MIHLATDKSRDKSGDKDNKQEQVSTGESYSAIIRYLIPEMITAFVLYSLLNLFDAKIVAGLKSTSTYATLGVTDTIIHFIIKVAEGLSVGTIVLCGQYNGQGRLKEAGATAMTSLWATGLLGMIISSFLFFGASSLYSWYGVPEKMIQLGVPFLRLRAAGIFFMFLYFSLIGFLRGVKNTRVPMYCFVIGALFFMFFDYVLVKGAFGFSSWGLQGSAAAFLIQYAVMCFAAIIYIVVNKQFYQYQLNPFIFNKNQALEIVALSWPVMIDKATLAGAKIWLGAMIAPTGKYALASFATIKNLEQLAFIPAIALGTIITFLVSNDVGHGRWTSIKSNIKKVLILALILVGITLTVFTLAIRLMISLFDDRGVFIDFAAQAFPAVSALVLFDLLQLILAAALRGAGDVRFVMIVRAFSTLLVLLPLSYLFSRWPFDHPLLKFILIYATFYISDAVMCLIYVKRFSGSKWYHYLLARKSRQQVKKT